MLLSTLVKWKNNSGRDFGPVRWRVTVLEQAP